MKMSDGADGRAGRPTVSSPYTMTPFQNLNYSNEDANVNTSLKKVTAAIGPVSGAKIDPYYLVS